MLSREIYLVKDSNKWIVRKAGGNTEDCDVTDVNVKVCFKKETVTTVKSNISKIAIGLTSMEKVTVVV